MPKTSMLECYKTSGLREGWKILLKDVVPRMDNQVDTKEMKHLLWSKTIEIKLWTSQLKKIISLPIPTTSRNRYLICCYNIHAAPIEPNWMMRIPSACYICKSEIMLEEGMSNPVTITCFPIVLCYKWLNWLIWTLGLSLLATCIGCTMHQECICTCQFEIPPSWVQRNYSSRKCS